MKLEDTNLFSATDAALQRLEHSSVRLANTLAGSRTYGNDEAALSRDTTFYDAMVTAMRSRFQEIREIAK